MEITEIKTKIQNHVEGLSAEKLNAVLEFLEDLLRSEEDETRILLNTPGFTEDYRNAKEDICAGKTIRWEDIRRDV